MQAVAVRTCSTEIQEMKVIIGALIIPFHAVYQICKSSLLQAEQV